MQRFHSAILILTLTVLNTLAGTVLTNAEPPPQADGVLPKDAQGVPLNLDLESGTLKDWRAEGDAFAGQPVEGDTVARRRSDMKSRHAGRFWVGSYERKGDTPQGTLTSRPFKVTLPFAKFLVAGGAFDSTCVELVRQDTKQVIFSASGDETEDLKPVVADLSKHLDKEIFVRLVDRHSGSWGHINFDDFRLYATRPDVPARPRPPSLDVYAHDGLPPAEAAAAMTVPEGFKVTLFAGEPDVVQPIAMAIDDRGRVWVAEAYSYPVRVPEDRARDRILIFEDTDGDGRFDTRKVFAEKLNLVSGLEVGFGGAWVGAAPHFLFIPDKDGDDRPDGPPQVLLDGWGYEDTHETLNSFAWGPDGWLYGCHGVFTHSKVGRPGTPNAERVPINAGIWRYHPTKHKFEVFAQGTSNPWGIDWDEHGQAFLTACVIPHLYHVIQGARYERQAGPHFNPYTFDDIKTIADHRHYLGATPHSGNGRSDLAGGGHAHAGAMIYLGGAWPDAYRGSLFMNNIHGARLNRDVLVPQGSGFVGKHAPDFLMANDRWSQVVSLKYGPDGQAYMIDWYDKNQCHHRDVNGHDRTNGRVFKVSYRGPATARPDMRGADDAALIAMQSHPNEWFSRHTRRVLQERGPNPQVRDAVRALAASSPDPKLRLRLLWTQHVTGGLDQPAIESGLKDVDPYVRAWTIQLACEDGPPSGPLLSRFAEMAGSDPSPVVRLYLASALQRLPLERRWGVLERLVAHSEDGADPNLPLMEWYAAEPLAALDPGRALGLATGSRIPVLLPFMTRRIAAIGTSAVIATLVEGLGSSGATSAQLALLEGLNEALKGRRRVSKPEAWPDVARKLAGSTDPRVRSQATALALTFGDPAALRSLRAVLGDGKADLAVRRDALAALLKSRDPDLPSALRGLLAEPSLRSQALRGLAAYDDPATPDAILAVFPHLTAEERRDALGTLSSRAAYARALLEAVASGRVAARDLTADVIRQLRSHKDPRVDERIAKVWGSARETSADKARLITRYKVMLTAKPTRPPDPALGRALFVTTCQQCHTLFGVGGRVGPELTGSNRADLDYLLSNVLDPSALIGKDYQAHVVSTTDGRVLTGIIRAEDRDSITVLSANDIVTVPKGEVEDRRVSDQSMMPDDLWKPLDEHEVRSLVAYLAGPSQVPLLATPENAAGLYNGRDLSGWDGDPTLWRVENGEIVGRTDGLGRNEFLRSDMVADDFRLNLDVKLVRDDGNSGIQFRSAPMAHGEVKGYQADIGPGWWGKLYEENGRGLLWSKSGEAHVKPGEWNHYEIVAVGPKIRTYLNGAPCVDLDDASWARRGLFAFQLHAGGKTEVRFKNVRLAVIPQRP
jgi:putative membrane-bound dehydrogenase-like protein